MSREDGFDRLCKWYIGDDDAESALYEIEKAKSQLAEIAYDLRIGHGLSIEELAEITGIDAKEIDDLEEGDYPGAPKDELARRIERILRERFGGTASNPSAEE